MRLIATLFVAALGAFLVLFVRIAPERVERHVWKGWDGDAPMDTTGLEPLDPARYTPAGRKLYPWYLGAYIATIGLALWLFVGFII